MANTYSQLNIHCVFAVKGRENIITRDFRDDLHRYMSGILKNDRSYPLAVGGWKDHVHVFFELPVAMSVSKQMQMLKSTSSKWINDNKLVLGRFMWQDGYGAFSYSRSQRDNVINYIMTQERHHGKTSFQEEYLELLKTFDVQYDPQYLFEFYE
jgi:REP element-mobilizing transposase RayT